jgi:hypothetical protein
VSMKVGQVRTLLRNNNIDINKETGTARGLVLGDKGDLNTAGEPALECTEVRVSAADVENYTTYNYQFAESVSRMHMSAISKGEASVGIPLIFSASTSHRIQHANRIDARHVRECKSFSVILPKARVVFEREKISPTNRFVAVVETAVDARREPAHELLKGFSRFGEFFATDTILGGRLIFRHNKKLEQSYTEEKNQIQFQLACKALIPEEPPVEGEGNWGAGLSLDDKNIVNNQSALIEHETRGGNGTQTKPNKWSPTVAKYLNWKVAGYNERSLEPTFVYFEQKLRARCIRILKDYFTNQMFLSATGVAGSKGGGSKDFGIDTDDSKALGIRADNVKRIVQIKINHGKNIDGLTITYELKNGQRKETPRIGWGRGERNDIIGPLAAEEEICAIEGFTAPDGLLRQLCFYTNLGSRFPRAADTYYGKTEGEKMAPFRIEAPRVRGIMGHVGNLIDTIGFDYLEFKMDTKSADFLRCIEPYLFPNLFPMNLPTGMEMTVKGMLVAGKWRQQRDLLMATQDDSRNTLIVELGGHSTESPNLQGFSNERLVEMAATVLFLMNAKLGLDRKWLQAHSAKDHREKVITFINSMTGEPEDSLRSLSDTQLLSCAFAFKPEAAKDLGKWSDAYEEQRLPA